MIKKNEITFILILILIFCSFSFLKIKLRQSVVVNHSLNQERSIDLKIDKKNLIQIKGIGEKTCSLILSNLNENGIINLEKLKKLNGIGDKRISLILERFYDKNP